MSRPWRIEFEGALYHVLSRRNEQQDIYLDNEDRNSAAANNAKLFCSTYSSVSRWVGFVRKQLREDKLVKAKLDRTNPLIKL